MWLNPLDSGVCSVIKGKVIIEIKSKAASEKIKDAFVLCLINIIRIISSLHVTGINIAPQKRARTNAKRAIRLMSR